MLTRYDAHVNFRATPSQNAKLRTLAEKCGLSAGEVLRLLIDSADIEYRPVVKSKNAVSTFQGADGAFVEVRQPA